MRNVNNIVPVHDVFIVLSTYFACDSSFVIRNFFSLKKFCLSVFFFFAAYVSIAMPANDSRSPLHADTIPQWCKGNFSDDYGIRYQVNDTLWVQLPDVKYHIIRWNTAEQYIIARNDDTNPSEKGLYTRIDYMPFSNMEPYRWGFCLTVYDAPDEMTAERKAKADRQNPRRGCNGFPFSRMKPVAENTVRQ
jgi:hypothetical protein